MKLKENSQEHHKVVSCPKTFFDYFHSTQEILIMAEKTYDWPCFSRGVTSQDETHAISNWRETDTFKRNSETLQKKNTARNTPKNNTKNSHVWKKFIMTVTIFAAEYILSGKKE